MVRDWNGRDGCERIGPLTINSGQRYSADDRSSRSLKPLESSGNLRPELLQYLLRNYGPVWDGKHKPDSASSPMRQRHSRPVFPSDSVRSTRSNSSPHGRSKLTSRSSGRSRSNSQSRQPTWGTSPAVFRRSNAGFNNEWFCTNSAGAQVPEGGQPTGCRIASASVAILLCRTTPMETHTPSYCRLTPKAGMDSMPTLPTAFRRA